MADCRTLQEAVKEMNSLESVVKQKDSKIKALESEVRFLLSPNRSSVGRASPNLTKKIRATTKFYSLLTSGLVAQMV